MSASIRSGRGGLLDCGQLQGAYREAASNLLLGGFNRLGDQCSDRFVTGTHGNQCHCGLAHIAPLAGELELQGVVVAIVLVEIGNGSLTHLDGLEGLRCKEAAPAGSAKRSHGGQNFRGERFECGHLLQVGGLGFHGASRVDWVCIHFKQSTCSQKLHDTGLAGWA